MELAERDVVEALERAPSAPNALEELFVGHILDDLAQGPVSGILHLWVPILSNAVTGFRSDRHVS